MKKIIAFLLIFLSANLLYGQNSKIDSLKNLLRAAKDDSNKLSIYHELVWLGTWSNPAEALQFAKQELLLARKAKLIETEAKVLGNIANVLSVLGDYPNSIDYDNAGGGGLPAIFAARLGAVAPGSASA